MSFGDLCSTDHLHYLMESCGQCGWQHPGLSRRPPEPTEGQRQAAAVRARLVEALWDIARNGSGFVAPESNADALMPLLAEAEARGHARGVAEAAELRERVEAIVAELSPHPDLRFSGWSIIGRLQRVMDGDA